MCGALTGAHVLDHVGGLEHLPGGEGGVGAMARVVLAAAEELHRAGRLLRAHNTQSTVSREQAARHMTTNIREASNQ